MRCADEPLITPEYSYVLGACFDVSILEDKNRPHVVANFKNFLSLSKQEKYFDMLMKWCPHKVVQLIEDSFAVSTYGGYIG